MTSLNNVAEHIAEICIKALRMGNKIVFCGNGGSAADSQHLAAELVSRLNFDRPALAAMALTVDTSVLTAIGNDYGFENIFSRQIEALGKSGDVLIAISTSGNSPNVLKAIETARKYNITVIGKTGERGGKMDDMCHFLYKAPFTETQKIQECHMAVGHEYCAMIERKMFAQ